MNWKPLMLGVVIGAVIGWYRTSRDGSSAPSAAGFQYHPGYGQGSGYGG
jgi:hypothetical protein